MNPSYFRIRVTKPGAMARFSRWRSSPELESPKEVALSDAVKLACDESGRWRGSALYLYENSGWTIFEDLSGGCSAIPASTWLGFAESDDFVFAGYNDAIGYGELIVIQNGAIVREFLYDSDNPEENVNRGQLAGSAIEPMTTWIQAARYVDDDDLVFSEQGVLWLHGRAT